MGDCRALNICIEEMARAAETDAQVLLTGETGTGKELFASALHMNSSRADRNFVVVDCTALPQTLAESTLFGHEKGAFTGAEKSREGLVGLADGGTLFLDEVCELSPSLQKIFLRVLQEKRFLPVGSNKEVASDFRLVAATNRDPDRLVKAHRFRKDLLYRLRTIAINLPPLRQRTEDIKSLADHYVDKIVVQNDLPPKGIAPDVIDMLCAYPWPGNVRELISTLENAVFNARQEPILFTKHLPTAIRVAVTRSGIRPADENEGTRGVDLPVVDDLPSKLRELPPYKAYCMTYRARQDQHYFNRLMALAGRDITAACRVSGLSRTQIYSHLKKHHIPRRKYRKRSG